MTGDGALEVLVGPGVKIASNALAAGLAFAVNAGFAAKIDNDSAGVDPDGGDGRVQVNDVI